MIELAVNYNPEEFGKSLMANFKRRNGVLYTTSTQKIINTKDTLLDLANYTTMAVVELDGTEKA